MSDNSLPNSSISFSQKRENRGRLKKLLAIISIVFVLFILPAAVNLALTPQDVRENAQVITDKAVSDVNLGRNISSQSNINNIQNVNSNDNLNWFWKIYPFVIGLVIIIWGGLIFIYFGSKYRKKI